jgi:hypothetical protein
MVFSGTASDNIGVATDLVHEHRLLGHGIRHNPMVGVDSIARGI